MYDPKKRESIMNSNPFEYMQSFMNNQEQGGASIH